MRTIPVRLALLAAGLAAAAVPTYLSGAAAPRPGVDWPQFRGIAARGVGEGKPTVTSWNLGSGQNIAWKVEIPGLGLSSPVVWGDLVCHSWSRRARFSNRWPPMT